MNDEPNKEIPTIESTKSYAIQWANISRNYSKEKWKGILRNWSRYYGDKHIIQSILAISPLERLATGDMLIESMYAAEAPKEEGEDTFMIQMYAMSRFTDETLTMIIECLTELLHEKFQREFSLIQPMTNPSTLLRIRKSVKEWVISAENFTPEQWIIECSNWDRMFDLEFFINESLKYPTREEREEYLKSVVSNERIVPKNYLGISNRSKIFIRNCLALSYLSDETLRKISQAMIDRFGKPAIEG